MARRLAEALLPEAPLHRHPDYWEDDGRHHLSIDEVRLLPDKPPVLHEQPLQEFLALKPSIGRVRFALITNAGRLLDQVQGILLKTLEEPHPNRVIVLTTPSASPFVLLPTVVSRCQRVDFRPLRETELKEFLMAQDIAKAKAQQLAALARGRPGWALSASMDPGVLERHHELLRQFKSVLSGNPSDALRLAAELDAAQLSWRSSDRANDDPAVAALTSWQLELRSRMVADEANRHRWARLLEVSFETLGQLEQNVSPRLALECFLLECQAPERLPVLT